MSSSVSPGPVAEPLDGGLSIRRLTDAGAEMAEKTTEARRRLQSSLELAIRRLGPHSRIPAAVVAAGLLYAALRRTGRRGMTIVTAAVGTFVPLYQSFKALSSGDEGTSRKWLMYWVCYALFRNIEASFDGVLALLPNYPALKLALLVWMQRAGAKFLYALAVHPSLTCNQARIDRGASMVKREVNQVSLEWHKLSARVEKAVRSVLEKEHSRGGPA